MKATDVLSKAGDMVTVRRVFGEPYEKDGVTVIPAAMVGGAGGAGMGHDEKGQEGEGGGFGMGGRPAGAYVVRNGEVTWRPAIDPNRMVLTVGAVVIAYLLTRPRLARARAKAARLDRKG
jgi:uncharacterized spore protein YtfJ